MNFFRSLGVAGRAYRSIVAFVLRPAFWMPFLVIAAAQAAGLAFLVGFHHPVLAPIAVPMVRLIGGDSATHYPGFFLYLPTLFSRLSLALGVLVASGATGVATLYFARALGFEFAGKPWSQARRHIPALILVSLFPAAVIVGMGELSRLVPRQLYLENGMVRWGLRGGLLAVVILMQSFFAYAAAWIVLAGHSVLGSLRDSVRVTTRTFLPTVFVVAIPLLALYPSSYVLQRVDLFVGKLRPETVAGLLLARIGAEALLGFLIVGAITRLFLWRMEAAR